MSYTRVATNLITAGKAALASIMQTIRDNQDFFAGEIGSLQAANLPNGSYEIASDPDAPNDPDNWTITEFLNGTFVLDETNPRHGAKIAKFTHPGGGGNGGGEALADYFACSPDRAFFLALTFWTTIAALRIKIEISYYTDAQVFISTETLYNLAAGNPTSASRQRFAMAIPATARYMRPRLTGGDTDTDPGGSADIYFDDVNFEDVESFRVGDVALSMPAGKFVGGPTGGLVLAVEATATVVKSAQAGMGSEFIITKPGSLRFKWDQSSGGGSGVASRVHRNGSPVGVTKSTSAPQSDDISGWVPGDLAQLYFNTDSSGFVRDFQIFTDDTQEVTNTQP